MSTRHECRGKKLRLYCNIESYDKDDDDNEDEDDYRFLCSELVRMDGWDGVNSLVFASKPTFNLDHNFALS